MGTWQTVVIDQGRGRYDGDAELCTGVAAQTLPAVGGADGYDSGYARVASFVFVVVVVTGSVAVVVVVVSRTKCRCVTR